MQVQVTVVRDGKWRPGQVVVGSGRSDGESHGSEFIEDSDVPGSSVKAMEDSNWRHEGRISGDRGVDKYFEDLRRAGRAIL